MEFSIRVLLSCVCVLMSCWGVFGYQCCTSYRDVDDTYHPSQMCADYCCLNPSVTNLKVCCSESWRQVPSDQRDQESCAESWITEHIWVPIVSGVVLVGLIVLCCCCCCCGCCCRRDRTVIVHQPGGPQANVVMSSQTSNMMHAGYNQ